MTDKAGKLALYKKIEGKKYGSKKDRESNFLSGVFVLSISAIVVKIIGLIYKIPMFRLLGSEGMGYFNSAYEIYALLCAISTAGLPIATSLLISRCNGRNGASETVFRISMKLFLAIGIVGMVIMLVLSYPISIFLRNSKSFYSFFAIAPTLLFICIVSAYRGYFQGMSRMAPTAISQLLEALCKLIFGIILALIALNLGYDTAKVAAFALIGLLLGSIVSAIYLTLLKRHDKNLIGQVRIERERGIVKELLRVAIPATFSAAVISITKMVDMTMILRRLQSIGYGSEQAFSVYGCYTTLALPMFALAPALISSVALPLIPRLSSAIASGDEEAQIDTVNDGIKLTCIISMPIGMGLSLFSKQILELVFCEQDAAIRFCAPLLSMLGMSVTLSCLVTVTNSILHAYGRPTVPLISITVGAFFKAVLAFVLIGCPNVNIAGAPISTFVCDLIINVINFKYICEYIPKPIDTGKALVRPFVASSSAVIFARMLFVALQKRYGDSSAVTLASIFSAAVMYAVLCLALRVTDKNDFKKLHRAKNA